MAWDQKQTFSNMWVNDTWMLEGRLEWNPLKPNQGPVVNSVEVNQANRRPDQNTQANLPVIIPSDDPLNVQPQCCFGGNPNEGFSRNQPTTGAYIRVFDHDIDPETNRKSGYQKLDKNGNPVLVKSPLPAWIFTLITHTDKTTHGLHSGGPGGGAALLGMFLLCDPADGGPHCMDE